MLFKFTLVLFCSICSGTRKGVDHQQTTFPSSSFTCGPVAGLCPKSRALFPQQGMPVFWESAGTA